MKYKFIKYTAVFFLLVGISAYIIDQTIDEGLLYQSQQNYQLEAATLSYNPVVEQQKDMAAKQKLALLNNIQLYDFLARSQQVKGSSQFANTLVSLNNKMGVIPNEKDRPKFLTKENAACRLLENRSRKSIPEATSVYREYQHQFGDTLKLSLTKEQLNNLWQSVHCQL